MQGVRIRFTLAALAAIALVSLGADTALSGGLGRRSWDEASQLRVRPVGGDYPELDLSLDLTSDGGLPGRITIYVPTGFQIYPDRPAESAVGNALIESQDSSYGTSTSSTLAGDIVAEALDPLAEQAAQACSPGTHLAMWRLELSLLGQPLDVPMYLAATGAGDPAGAQLKLELCPPTLPTQGAGSAPAMPISSLDLSLTDLEPPHAHGSYLWRAVVTPLAPDRKTLRPDRAYELRANVPVPHRLTLAGTYLRKNGIAVLRGQLSENGKPRAATRVQLTALIRTVTSGGVHFADHSAGTVLTDKTGHYTLRVPIRKTTGFVAFVSDTTRRCQGAALAPGGCVSTTTAAILSEPITISVPAQAAHR